MNVYHVKFNFLNGLFLETDMQLDVASRESAAKWLQQTMERQKSMAIHFADEKKSRVVVFSNVIFADVSDV